MLILVSKHGPVFFFKKELLLKKRWKNGPGSYLQIHSDNSEGWAKIFSLIMWPYNLIFHLNSFVISYVWRMQWGFSVPWLPHLSGRLLSTTAICPLITCIFSISEHKLEHTAPFEYHSHSSLAIQWDFHSVHLPFNFLPIRHSPSFSLFLHISA